MLENIYLYLPEPGSFANIVDDVLISRFPVVVEWWWTRSLEYRTPEHLFGGWYETPELWQFRRVQNLDWYWQHYQESRAYELGHFAHWFAWADDPLGLVFTVNAKTTLPILQCAVKKSTALGEPKVKLDQQQIVAMAIAIGQIASIEWWDRHQDQLPTQELDHCAGHLVTSVEQDAVDVFKWWWNMRLFPVSKATWQQVCVNTIRFNSHRVQAWLLDHAFLFADPDRNENAFADARLSALHWPTPVTLDFLHAIVPDLDLSQHVLLPNHAYYCLSMLH
ncbi:hypothetical protein BC828DRAFT_374473 [Blastocladiella britannica]|nr:hypothetical protein BC828DRAFT_374473 [Blastocladiella britannica]